MTRAKPKRPGTRSGTTRRGANLPDDLPDAAEAALEDLLRADEDADEEILTTSAAQAFEEHTIRRPKLAEPTESGTMPIDALDEEDVESEEIVTEVPALRVGVFEDSTQLRSAQSALGAAGHVVAVGASGREGLQQVLAAVRGGTLDVVMVAVPGGEAIIDAALALETNRPVVIASVDGNPLTAVNRALASGADLAAVRPHDVGSIAPILLAANRLMIERKLASDPEPRGLQTFEAFQRVLELAIVRAQKLEYPLSVALYQVDVSPPPPPGIGGIVKARAGNALVHAIRDIDVATQLEGDRFLVLLPYTDLKRAAGLAQRVIQAVTAGEAVVSGGRAYPPKIVGAVAAARLNEPVSFARLVKDATRTLEQARRDGADFAVQP